ncbi:MAG: flagellar brake protein [Burkholderiaceae bacterium]|nr:flagellar brake protein [Burkholderiaceae bacterium]
MSNAAASPTGPDAPGALNPEFRIEGEFAVRAVLRELMTRRALVTLYPEGRADDAFVTRIVHVAPDGVELDVSGQTRSAAALRNASYAVGVAFPQNVKTQFRLERMELSDAIARRDGDGDGDSDRDGDGDGDGGDSDSGQEGAGDDSETKRAAQLVTTLHAPVPAELHRLQRRESFRVHPPPEDDAHCVQRIAIGRELRHPIIDLSAGGLSIRMTAADARPARGRIWRHSRIETSSSLVIPCELVTQGVYDDPSVEGAHRVAFAFHAMPGETVRRVQMYVLDIERRRRHEDGAPGASEHAGKEGEPGAGSAGGEDAPGGHGRDGEDG